MSTQLFSLEKKVAVVTGASRGIGREIALGLARAGAAVAVAARTRHDLESLTAEIESLGARAFAVPTDVTDREQVESLLEQTLERWNGLDILVNNAGGTRFAAPLVGVRPDGWDKVMRLNLDSVFHATQIVSVAGISGAPGLSFYSAAKGAVKLMTQSAAKELAQSGVRLNSIAPGWIKTDLNAMLHDDPASKDFVTTMIPMGRWGEPHEIVGAAIYLASDASSFVTGTTLVVDGGQTA